MKLSPHCELAAWLLDQPAGWSTTVRLSSGGGHLAAAMMPAKCVLSWRRPDAELAELRYKLIARAAWRRTRREWPMIKWRLAQVRTWGAEIWLPVGVRAAPEVRAKGEVGGHLAPTSARFAARRKSRRRAQCAASSSPLPSQRAAGGAMQMRLARRPPSRRPDAICRPAALVVSASRPAGRSLARSVGWSC